MIDELGFEKRLELLKCCCPVGDATGERFNLDCMVPETIVKSVLISAFDVSVMFQMLSL